MNRIDVTCAIICAGQRVLVCQRGAETDHPFEWEFPGGKIEDGETSEACIIREIQEELNVQVRVVEPLIAVECDYPTKKIRLIPFLCDIVYGQLNPTEHVAVKWQPIISIGELKWSMADQEILKLNKKIFL